MKEVKYYPGITETINQENYLLQTKIRKEFDGKWYYKLASVQFPVANYESYNTRATFDINYIVHKIKTFWESPDEYSSIDELQISEKERLLFEN